MSWQNVALGEVTDKIGSGATPQGGSEVYKAAGIPFIRSMNVHDGDFRADGLVFLDELQARALQHVTLADGTCFSISLGHRWHVHVDCHRGMLGAE
jgi:hypothetical protein